MSVVIVGLDSAAGLDDKYHLRVNLKMSKLKNIKQNNLIENLFKFFLHVVKYQYIL
jgi:hypothetical protein